MAIPTQGVRTATIRAEEDVQLWRLDSAAFYDMMFDQINIAQEMMKLLSRRLRSRLKQGSDVSRSGLHSAKAEAAAARAIHAADPDVMEQTKDEAILRFIPERLRLVGPIGG